MKKLILLLAVVFNIHTIAAQATGSINKGKPALDEAVVPASAKDGFRQENPNEEVTWIMDGKNYKAQYVDDSNVSHSRIFDQSGKLIWRDDEMSSYPTPISDYYTKTYPGEGYMIWSRIDNNGVTTYYSYHNAEAIWFDKSGNVISPKQKAKQNQGVKMK